MLPSDCPSDEVWAAFPDCLSEEEREVLRGHLATCSPCRTTIAELVRQGVIESRDVGERLGRFVLVAVLGQGGIGTVYSAYDPQLDRRVALKLLRNDDLGPAGQSRMIREAQALAQIAHPNVVPIHEVAELDGQLVLVMEYIEGQTLGAFADARPPWREIVKAYLQAGRGLEAMHAAGLVHRDFKPSNAMIGADGRVRVIDFGLVRLRGETVGIGTVLGTPAYMPPEQLISANVGSESDVYCFCMSLAEALYGGEREPTPTSGVPGRVWSVLRPGLSTDPQARPRLGALLQELDALIHRRRRRWALAAAAGVLAIALSVGLVARREAATPPCSGGDARLAEVWNPHVSGAIDRRLEHTLGAYADEVAPRIATTLERYGRDWSTGYRDACLVHHRGEQSGALLDKRMHCLERQRQALADAVALLQETDASKDPVRLVLGLPSPAACADLDHLAAEEPLPADPLVRVRVRELEGRLGRAAALERNGDYGEAAAIADGVAGDARALGMTRLEASARLALGRARLLGGQLEAAVEPLREAQREAIRADRPEMAAEAIARRIFVQGVGGVLSEERLTELHEVAEDFLARASDGSFEHALLLNNVGVVFRNLGDRPRARAILERALEAQGRVGRFEMELGVIVDNLAAVTDDPEERRKLFDRAADDALRQLGPHHPETLRTLIVRAAAIRDPRERHDELATVCDAVARYHRSLVSVQGSCALELGWAAEELDERDEATAHYRRAAEAFARAGNVLFGELAAGQAAHLAGQPAEAEAAFARLEAALGTGERRPWQHALSALALASRAELAAAAGRHGEAVALAESAITILTGLDLAGQVQWQVALARARATATRSLHAQRGGGATSPSRRRSGSRRPRRGRSRPR